MRIRTEDWGAGASRLELLIPVLSRALLPLTDPNGWHGHVDGVARESGRHDSSRPDRRGGTGNRRNGHRRAGSGTEASPGVGRVDSPSTLVDAVRHLLIDLDARNRRLVPRQADGSRPRVPPRAPDYPGHPLDPAGWPLVVESLTSWRAYRERSTAWRSMGPVLSHPWRHSHKASPSGSAPTDFLAVIARRVADVVRATAASESGSLAADHNGNGTSRLAVARPADVPMLSIASQDLLAHAAGRREVVRYAFNGPQEEPLLLLRKAYAQPARALLAHDNLWVLAAGPFREGSLRVSAPLAFLPRAGSLLFRPADGVALDVTQRPVPVRELRGAAQWLARLHGSDVKLHRRLDLEREAISARQWAVLIGGREPTLLRSARVLAERWADAARLVPVRLDVPVHKDFHPGHVIVGRDVTVIDLDEARMGDPALDVAHFCAYLDLLAGPMAGACRSVFMEEYIGASSWPVDERVSLFGAYTWLKIAKQIATGSGPLAAVTGSECTHLVSRALSRGLACLDG